MALHTQLLTSANAPSSAISADTFTDLVNTLGYVQVDTLQVVNRAHYLTLWARLGAYDISDFDRLIYTAGQRRLYEGWGHAASIIPLEHHRYHRWRTDHRYSYNPVFRTWLQQESNRQLVEQTLARIRSEGGLRTGDFAYDGPKRDNWFDWKPSKTALEVLFARGDIMVADRIHFHRVYDLRERVLPDDLETSPVSPEEGRRFCLEQAALALGVFELRHLLLYAYMRATPIRPMLLEMVKDGTLAEIRGEAVQGNKKWLVHRDRLPLLQRVADREITAGRTTFLSPFDSLFWARGRDESLWGFRQVLESYKPAQDRSYGYFSLPILHQDRLVGRFDPRLDRKTGTMYLNALFLEPGIVLDEALAAGFGAAMRDFLSWHGADKLIIDRSEPAEFGRMLVRATGAWGTN